MKRSPILSIILWAIVFAASSALLHFLHGYHFLYISQEHMFLNDSAYVLGHLFSIGGLSTLGADWLVQFFCRPYIGPLCVSAVLLLSGLFLQGFLRRTFPTRRLTAIALIPIVVFLFLSYKDDFDFSNLVAMLFVSFFLALFSRFKSSGIRVVFALAAIALLVPAAGWIAAFFALGAIFSFCTYEGGLKLNMSFPAVLTVGLQLILLLVSGFFAYRSSAGQDDLYKELDWYLYNDEPDKALNALAKGGKDNYVYENFANWALARKGVLLDNMFSYPQHNPYSLILEWKEIAYTSVLLSNIYWSVGHVALSQRMAFEANVIYDNSNPRMLQRLVQTNLVNRYDKVAGKYLDRLGKCRPYRRYSEAQMRFFGDTTALAADPVLGGAMRCIPAENALSESAGDIFWDLEKIYRSNPECVMARDYAAAWMLLKKDTRSFVPFLEEFFAGKKLPKALAEAVMIASEGNAELLEQWNISPEIANRYGDFKAFYTQNAKSPDLKQKIRREFGDTYWYYFLYFKSE